MTTLVTINTYSLLVLRDDVAMYCEHSTYGTKTKGDIQHINDLLSALHEASVCLNSDEDTVQVTTRTIRFLLEETKAMFEHTEWGMVFDDEETLEKTKDLTQAMLHAMEALDIKDEPQATLVEVA